MRASRLTTSAHSGQRFRSPFFKPSCSMTFCVGRIRNEAGHATGRNRKPKIHHSHRLYPFFAALEDGARAQIAASNRYRGRRRKRSIGALTEHVLAPPNLLARTPPRLPSGEYLVRPDYVNLNRMQGRCAHVGRTGFLLAGLPTRMETSRNQAVVND